MGLITATQVVVGMAARGRRHNWILVFFTTVAAWLIFSFATPVILLLSRRFPLAKPGDWRNLPAHLAAALGIGIAHVTWSATLEWLVNPLASHPAPSFRGAFFTTVYMQFHTGIIIYAARPWRLGNTVDSDPVALAPLAKRRRRGSLANYPRRSWTPSAVSWSRIFCSTP